MSSSIRDELRHRPAWALLWAGRSHLAQTDARAAAGMHWELMLLAVAIGVGLAFLWSGAWALFGDGFSGLLLAPATAVLVVMVLGVYRHATMSLGGLLSRRSPAGLGVSVVVVTLLTCLLGLRSWHADWPTHLPAAIQWLRPDPHFRVLVLMPVWGMWSMMAVCLFAPVTRRTELAVVELVRRVGAGFVAFWMVVLVLGSSWWFSFLPAPFNGVPVSITPIIVGIVAGLWFCHRTGGLTRRALLATNLLTQMAFAFAYEACL